MKRVIIITVGAILIILIPGGYYWHYTRSPKYSLLRAKHAYEQHDITTFEKYVDIEGVLNNLIDQLLKVTQQKSNAKDEWEQLGESFATGLITLLKPQLTKALKQQVIKLVETGKFEDTRRTSGEKKLSLSEILNEADAKKAGFRGIEYIKREGKIAYVGIKFYNERYKSDLILELKMRDRSGYWQIAEISNFDEFLKKIEQLEEEADPKSGKFYENGSQEKKLIVENYRRVKVILL